MLYPIKIMDKLTQFGIWDVKAGFRLTINTQGCIVHGEVLNTSVCNAVFHLIQIHVRRKIRLLSPFDI